MPRFIRGGAFPRLVVLFGCASLLPAAALAWLGWQVVEQDRHLERQRVQEVVERTANTITAEIERHLGAIERSLASPVGAPESRLSIESVAVALDRHGRSTPIAGAPLLFDPAVSPTADEPPQMRWAEAERLELVAHDPDAAIRAYRALAAAPDPNVRAGALVRLARTLKRAGRSDQALDTYSALATLTGAALLGDPADLMARSARVELLAALERRDAWRAESAALDADLRNGRWRLNRTTALAHLTAIEPARSQAEETALVERIQLADTVAAVWDEWHRRPASLPPSGSRRSLRIAGRDMLVVSREGAERLVVFAAPPQYLARTWNTIWTAPHIAAALVNQEGTAIVGTMPASGVPVVRPASETRLPWTVRVAAISTPPEIAATSAARRRLIVGVLSTMAFLIVGTAYLISRTVHKEMALARQQAAFVSAVSHEFRSPLTSLTHLTSLLRSDFEPTNDRRRQYYDMLAHETDRLRRFVETLLDFGRIQAGAVRYRLASVDLAPLVIGLVEEFRQHAACGRHQVSVVAHAAPRPVAADAEALGRALWNLLENAAKYSPDDSIIAVVLEDDDGRVAVRVSDRGTGIPPDEQPFVFDQFFRGAAAAQSAVKGTGVGLAVVRHIARGHGGDVLLDSRVGAGSTFTIVLPALSEPERVEGLGLSERTSQRVEGS